jgi:GNAT superfamily N-acetyltransferase
MVAKNQRFQVGLLRESELEEAGRIVRLAFGTFLGLPNPLEFMGDRDFVSPRWRSRNTKVLAAREDGKLIGSNVVTRWGSFGFFGPLSILPDYWNRSVAQQLLAATMKVFDRWGVRYSGLFTFPNSPKHVGLYQKFGYWPGYLTAVMNRAPAAPSSTPAYGAKEPVLLSALTRSAREQAIAACAKLASRIEQGLDLSDEIRAAVAQRTGEVLLLYGRNTLDAFAVCMHGPGSEGGEKICYVKFGAASSGERFEGLLDAIDALALARGAEVEAGVSTACADAFERMRSRGYRPAALGVAMQRPHGEGFNRSGAHVLGDWR